MNILELDQVFNPSGGTIYMVVGGVDKFIETPDFLNLKYNNSVRFNKQTITGLITNNILFTQRPGQESFADANYLLIPFTYDSTGLYVPVQFSNFTKDGFNIYVDIDDSVTLNYLAIHL